MLFPVVVHKQPRSAYGVTIPDLPGCVTAGDTLDQALRNVQEAVEAYLHGEPDVPIASPLDRWVRDPEFADGIFALVDVNLDFMADETVRVNITARRSALALIDRVARSRGEDRSEFLIRAALERAAGSAAMPAAGYGRKGRPATARPPTAKARGRKR
ncbi:MAG: type II toxin-antitoxin system HicB family antitoxin [Burkholderiales bacterium]